MTDTLPLSERIDLHLKVHAGTLLISGDEMKHIRDVLRMADRVNKMHEILDGDLNRARSVIQKTQSIQADAKARLKVLNDARHNVRQFATLAFGVYWLHALLTEITSAIIGG